MESRWRPLIGEQTDWPTCWPKSTTNPIASACELIKHKMGVLGAVTHAANHCQKWVRSEDGTWKKVTCRDAQQSTTKPIAANPRKNKRKATVTDMCDDLVEHTAVTECPAYVAKRTRRFNSRVCKKVDTASAAYMAYQACLATAERITKGSEAAALSNSLACTAQQAATQPLPTNCVTNSHVQCTNGYSTEGSAHKPVWENKCVIPAEMRRQRPQKAPVTSTSSGAVNAAISRLLGRN